MTESGSRQAEERRPDATEVASGGPTITFDHISLAVRQATDLWPILAGALGGRYVGSGLGPGFGWTQIQFANGFRVEGLHPETAGSTTSFVADFIDRYGVGPHHLTFRVQNLAEIVARLDDAGYDVIERKYTDPVEWSEALIRAQDAHGTMVQILDEIPPTTTSEDVPEGFPEGDYDRQIASLARVVHAVRDLPGALTLYRDILGGKVLSTGSAIDGNHWVELGWGGAGRLRLLEGVHAEIAEWIGDLPGRVRHLFFNFDEPEYLPGATKVASGRWVIARDDVLGTRIVVSSSAR